MGQEHSTALKKAFEKLDTGTAGDAGLRRPPNLFVCLSVRRDQFASSGVAWCLSNADSWIERFITTCLYGSAMNWVPLKQASAGALREGTEPAPSSSFRFLFDCITFDTYFAEDFSLFASFLTTFTDVCYWMNALQDHNGQLNLADILTIQDVGGVEHLVHNGPLLLFRVRSTSRDRGISPAVLQSEDENSENRMHDDVDIAA